MNFFTNYGILVTDFVLVRPFCGMIQINIRNNNKKKRNKHVVVNMNYILSIDSVNRYIKLINNYGELEIGPRLKKEFMSRLKNE